MPLFDRNPLDDGTGLLSERWGQEGSNIVNISEGVTNASNETIYTVTAGKTLFITDLTIQVSSGPANAVHFIQDDGSGGTVKIAVDAQNYTGGEVVNFNFKTPLKFSVDVYWKSGSPTGTNEMLLTFSGWEE